MIDIVNRKNLLKTFLKFPQRNIIIIFFFIGFGEWLISDLMHLSGGTAGFVLASLGGYFLLKKDQPEFNEPKDINGWIRICNDDIKVLEELEKKNNNCKNNLLRKETLEKIILNYEKQSFSLVGDNIFDFYNDLFKKYFKQDTYNLDVINQLPSLISNTFSDQKIYNEDAIFYHINLPLSAKGLLWLNQFPKDMPIWLFTASPQNKTELDQIEGLKEEVPENLKNNIIYFDSKKNILNKVPLNFRKFAFNPNKNIENTKKRVLRELHSKWQAEIEVVRRIKLKEIQRKNQIMVAASVLASPVPSIDVLSMTVLNSLMIKEMKAVWSCNWSPEILEKVSKQIIKAAIAQGVVEWSGQTLLNISKFHGPNWLLAGSFQAISAAYLTRVVSRSLADFMAISKGVTEPDLEFIKNNSENIVKNAFESEKINWKNLFNDLRDTPIFKFS